eukprot:997271-Pelagomonas_calceolata.AAC.1
MGPTTRLSDRGQTLSHQHNPSSYNVPDAATLSSYIRSNISRMNADSNPGFEPPQPLSSNAQKEQMTEGSIAQKIIPPFFERLIPLAIVIWCASKSLLLSSGVLPKA